MCIRDRGISGGDAAALNAFSYQSGDEWHKPPMVSKMRGIKLKQGEAVRLETPGGGGYGAVGSREPNKVAIDVARGLVSDARADTLYGSQWRSVKL